MRCGRPAGASLPQTLEPSQRELQRRIRREPLKAVGVDGEVELAGLEPVGPGGGDGQSPGGDDRRLLG